LRRMIVKRRTLLLYSGGLDSHLLWLHQDKPQRVMFTETVLTREQRELLLDPTWLPNDASKLLPMPPLPKWSGGFVPYRNLAFIMQASLLCGSQPVEILIGQTLEWQVDKNAAFYREMRSIARRLARIDLIVRAPLANRTKTGIVRDALARGVPVEEITNTHSCLTVTIVGQAEGKHCGRCSSCVARWAAFRNNGIVDLSYTHEPTRFDYEKNVEAQRWMFRWQNVPMYLIRHAEMMRAFARREKEGPWALR